MVANPETGLFIIPNLLSQAEARALVDLSEQYQYQPALVKTKAGPSLLPQVRKNQRLEPNDAELSHLVLTRLRSHTETAQASQLNAVLNNCSNINPAWRFYRYQAGDYFKWHRDGVVHANDQEVSQYTLLIYLNQDYQGGRTCFKTMKIQAETGMALIFRHHLLHRSELLTSGRKYLLRSDLMLKLT